jgi:hypothetical protein
MKNLQRFHQSKVGALGLAIPLLAVGLLAFSVAPRAADASPAKKHVGKSIRYKNSEYGFTFTLPGSWKGYSILVEKWRGGVTDGSGRPIGHEEGPLIRIRHPHWSEANPWQDIPIMVLTLDQWDLVDQFELVVSAAPFGPGEIGRNSNYIFALPPRYNYADVNGVEEVNAIMQGDPLHPF